MDRPDIEGIEYRANAFLEDHLHPTMGVAKDDVLTLIAYIEELETRLVWCDTGHVARVKRYRELNPGATLKAAVEEVRGGWVPLKDNTNA